MGKKTSAHYDKPLNAEASGSGGAKTAGVTFKENGYVLHNVTEGIETSRSPACSNIAAGAGTRMTVRELAEVLGVSRQSIYRAMEKAGISDLSKNGQATHLNEPQATAVKMNLRKTAKVLETPKTRLEKAMLIQQALRLQDELIQELKDENARLEAAFGREVLDHRGTRAVLSERTAGLETVQRIAEAGGLLVSDREDLLNTYRRNRER